MVNQSSLTSLIEGVGRFRDSKPPSAYPPQGGLPSGESALQLWNDDSW
ncbi:MAG: hypothetical protein K9L60_05675 [Methylovulum sp.]|nr:hypothetical protein [Methylovulum sp.]MCF7998705.1 hypothetical protein [Methylovulum sp.]